MEEWLNRTVLLLGEEKVRKLAGKNVLVVGLGGVGAYAAEMICRAGVGRMTIVDGDVVKRSNRNRQLPALESTEGKSKSAIMGDRLKDINPQLELTIINEFLRDDRMIEVLQDDFDYVVDAIDTLSPKVFLIFHTVNRGIPIVSSMGAGGKVDPLSVKISDIDESYTCPLARIVRKKLHRLGVREGVKVVFSDEVVDKEKIILTDEETNKASIVGTISYMPAIFGICCASVVIRDLTTQDN